jgi:hypothetical protein
VTWLLLIPSSPTSLAKKGFVSVELSYELNNMPLLTWTWHVVFG